jgi:hypothetical protein
MTRSRGGRITPADGAKAPEKPRKVGATRWKPAPKERLVDQTRKLLGKHYANRYRTGRGG